jgi:hypothetical protein
MELEFVPFIKWITHFIYNLIGYALWGPQKPTRWIQIYTNTS